MSVITLVGGQYGSEGKGVIASKLSPAVNAAVRVGAPNAGHSIIHEGRVWKMRSIPCAWTNPDALLILGAGAIIDEGVLSVEIHALEDAGYSIRDRLFIDERAWMLTPNDMVKDEENVQRIGSTGEGIGPARMRRMQRIKTLRASLPSWLPSQIDTTALLAPIVDHGLVLLEGTQGFGLSLVHGEWPFVTTTDCTAPQLWNDCGIVPPDGSITIMVMRTYPIRVAGTSGPLRGELTWEQMSEHIGKPVEERTTVTNKVRRIGTWDWELAHRAVRINRPNVIALTFADYLDPKVEGATRMGQLTEPVLSFMQEIEERLSVPVGAIGTGGPEWSVILRSPLSAR